jgi:signal transduction histidine kinase
LARKKTDSVTEAVEAYLAELTLDGAQKPLASVARLLAESLEAAPPYARARLARELHDLLTELEAQAARQSEMAEFREKRGRQSAWVRDG